MAVRPILADSNRASLREIIESNTDWGTTPTSGVTRARRFTSSSILASKETVVSDELRDDRMVSSVIETAAMSGGDINFEFAAGTVDNDLQRVLMGAWSRPMEWDFFKGTRVSITGNNTIAIAGGDFENYFTAGRRIKTSGFVNPANNDYFEIDSVAHSANVTTITITTTTLVSEEGSSFTKVQDANDVILLKSTAIRFNNSPNTIDSETNNAFASAIAAGQLVVGQNVYIEGIGYESGSFALSSVVATDAVTVNDGVNPAITFTAVASNPGENQFEVGANDGETATNLAAAINAKRPSGELNVVATVSTTTVTVKNLFKTGGTLSDDDTTITTTDFTGGDTTHGGFYRIVSLTDDSITFNRAVPTLASGTPITIKGSMLRNPSTSADITAQSCSIETGFQDVGQFFLADGLRAGGLSMEITAGSIVTGTVTMMGRQTRRFNTEQLGNTANYTVLDAPATEVVSATANVGSLSVDDEEFSTAIQSIQFSLEGNLRNQMAVSQKFPAGIAAGRLTLSGTIEAYFANGELYDRFINHETVALSFPIEDIDGNTYRFTIPAFKIASDPIAPGGIDQDVMESMEFNAFRDPTTDCMIQIDRFSSNEPVTTV